MRNIRTRWAGWTIAIGAGLAGLVWFAWPQPVLVDLAHIIRGPMEVTVNDDAKTHVRHIYTVSAPVAGKVLRISHPVGSEGAFSRHVGDEVKANATVVAVMQPTTPSFVDFRSREEAQAAVTAADAYVKYAESEVRRLEAAVTFYRGELARAQALARTQTVSVQALDKARFDAESNEAALVSANAQVAVWQGVSRSLAARLIDPSSALPMDDPVCCIQIRAPATGRVLKIIQESEAVVQVGTPLLEIGDPLDLEVVADLLSTDAVGIKPGAPVRIDGWGGAPINARVTRVDPAGFLKVSALGIEEQRVRVTIDFVDEPKSWSTLGHDYRVTVHVTVWNSDNALTVPVGALFRKGESWAVFLAKEGRARITLVQIGHRNINRVAEVISGLSIGDQVVLHPSDRISDGVRVANRENR
jgi:HlyD family secretion protein